MTGVSKAMAECGDPVAAGKVSYFLSCLFLAGYLSLIGNRYNYVCVVSGRVQVLSASKLKIFFLKKNIYIIFVYLSKGGFMFNDEQRAVLLKYFNEYGMTSTHRRNMDLMQQCMQEVGTTMERVKVGRT